MYTILQAIVVIATCYHAVPSQCNDDCLTTASGAKICSSDSAYTHRYLAVSRDLLDLYPLGSVVHVSNAEHEIYNGVWYVEDKMNKRYSKSIDFLINPGMPLQKSEAIIELYK